MRKFSDAREREAQSGSDMNEVLKVRKEWGGKEGEDYVVLFVVLGMNFVRLHWLGGPDDLR